MEKAAATTGPLHGLIILDKPAGTSCGRLCRSLGRLLGVEKIGHVGTLDPMATGVLPICLGEATKLSHYLTTDEKIYEAVIIFGSTTDTEDAQGQVTGTYKLPADLDEQRIQEVLKTFLGAQEQRPSAFSAKKVNGMSAYRAARRGKPLTLAPQKIFIHSLDFLEWQKPSLKLRIHCSKGTYIRALARDLGLALGCGAHLGALRRLKSGIFGLENAWTIERLESQGLAASDLIGLSEALPLFPAIVASGAEKTHILRGQSLGASWFLNKAAVALAEEISSEKPLKVLDEDRQLLALVKPAPSTSNLTGSAENFVYLRVFGPVNAG